MEHAPYLVIMLRRRKSQVVVAACSEGLYRESNDSAGICWILGNLHRFHSKSWNIKPWSWKGRLKRK